MKIKTLNEAIPAMIRTLVDGDLVTANMLLDRFPKLLTLRDKHGRNLLMHAAYYGDPSVLSYLVSFYVIANPAIDPMAQDNEGFTAYDWAVLGNNGFGASLISKVINPE